jgi:hypothetical protein
VHPRDRGLGVIAELLRDPLGAPLLAVGPDGCGDSLPDLTRVRLIGALQYRHEQGVGPDRGSTGVARRYLHVRSALSAVFGPAWLHRTLIVKPARPGSAGAAGRSGPAQGALL